MSKTTTEPPAESPTLTITYLSSDGEPVTNPTVIPQHNNVTVTCSVHGGYPEVTSQQINIVCDEFRVDSDTLVMTSVQYNNNTPVLCQCSATHPSLCYHNIDRRRFTVSGNVLIVLLISNLLFAMGHFT